MHLADSSVAEGLVWQGSLPAIDSASEPVGYDYGTDRCQLRHRLMGREMWELWQSVSHIACNLRDGMPLYAADRGVSRE